MLGRFVRAFVTVSLASAFARPTISLASVFALLTISSRIRSLHGSWSPRPRAARQSVICSALCPALSRTLFVCSPTFSRASLTAPSGERRLLQMCHHFPDAIHITVDGLAVVAAHRNREGDVLDRVRQGLSAILAPARAASPLPWSRVCQISWNGRRVPDLETACWSRDRHLAEVVDQVSSVRSRRSPCQCGARPARPEPRCAGSRSLLREPQLLCGLCPRIRDDPLRLGSCLRDVLVRLGFRTVRCSAGIDDDVRSLGPCLAVSSSACPWAAATISAPLS